MTDKSKNFHNPDAAKDWNDQHWSYYMMRCKRYAVSKKFECDKEDFSQYACLHKFNGRKASVGQLFIDYLRQHYGDTRCVSNIKRSQEYLTDKRGLDGEAFDYGSIRDDSEHSLPDRLYDDRVRTRDNEKKIKLLLLDLNFDDFLSAYLTLFRRMSLRDISNLFDVTESRICQRMKRVKSEVNL